MLVFFVGYSSNSKAYRVFNNATRMIEETCDVEFDENNDSQGKEFSCDDVGDESLREVMKNIAIGQVKPKEEVEELPCSFTQVEATFKDDTKDEEKRKLHHTTIMSHPMKKMAPHILPMTPKMNKWLKNNFHLMTHTSQVNKPKLKPKMSNH